MRERMVGELPHMGAKDSSNFGLRREALGENGSLPRQHEPDERVVARPHRNYKHNYAFPTPQKKEHVGLPKRTCLCGHKQGQGQRGSEDHLPQQLLLPSS